MITWMTPRMVYTAANSRRPPLARPSAGASAGASPRARRAGRGSRSPRARSSASWRRKSSSESLPAAWSSWVSRISRYLASLRASRSARRGSSRSPSLGGRRTAAGARRPPRERAAARRTGPPPARSGLGPGEVAAEPRAAARLETRRRRAPRGGPDRDQRPGERDQRADPHPADQRVDDHAEGGRRRSSAVGLGDLGGIDCSRWICASATGRRRVGGSAAHQRSPPRHRGGVPARPTQSRKRAASAAAPRAGRRPMSGWTAVQKSLRRPRLQADLAGRLAVEEAADRSRSAGAGRAGSSCASGEQGRTTSPSSLARRAGRRRRCARC